MINSVKNYSISYTQFRYKTITKVSCSGQEKSLHHIVCFFFSSQHEAQHPTADFNRNWRVSKSKFKYAIQQACEISENVFIHTVSLLRMQKKSQKPTTS